MSQLITAKELHVLLEQTPQVCLVDVRFQLKDPAWGARAYQQGHIAGAVYMDLDKDLSSPVQEHGGRHPLPRVEDFADTLGRAGIQRDSHVVVYDQGNGMFAARLWWLLRYYGVEKVQLLDGGLQSWQHVGYSLSTELVQPALTIFDVALQAHMLADISTVEGAIDNLTTTIVDARAAERYRGEVEPMDPKAGHIPSAISKPFANNLENGVYKSHVELVTHYADVLEAEQIICYCGSGVTACHNILAMTEVGIPIDKLKLYAGSWSDWSSYEDKPVAIG